MVLAEEHDRMEMIMKVVRIGVIGTGIMGERHCRVCANLPRVDLVGITDLNEARGQEMADRYEKTYYRDYRHLLSRLDAVTIATTTDSHFDLTKACLEQGLHVMSEKSITETIEQAQQLIKMAFFVTPCRR
jgi:predicted dehydrogenase